MNAPFRSDSIGAAIRVGNEIDLTIQRKLEDENGYFISAFIILYYITIDGMGFNHTNLYGPNVDDSIFYVKLYI